MRNRIELMIRQLTIRLHADISRFIPSRIAVIGTAENGET